MLPAVLVSLLLLLCVQSSPVDYCHVHSITVLVYESKALGGVDFKCYSRGAHFMTYKGGNNRVEQDMCGVMVTCQNHAPHFQRNGTYAKDVVNECNTAQILIVDDSLMAICTDESKVEHKHDHDHDHDHGNHDDDDDRDGHHDGDEDED